MQIFPAIDLQGGKVVRLTQGDYNRKDIYSDYPSQMAEEFLAKGASNLHVVDLDGAKDATTANFATISDIAKIKGLVIQVGGGIRDEQRINKYLDLGVDRVILGTAAAEDFAFLTKMVDTYKEKIAVGVDARQGKLAVNGWLENTAIDSLEFCKSLDEIGVQTIIYTDISRDGAMLGTNLAVYHTLSKLVGCNIIASGGISSAEEITKLAEMGIYGAIVGKAIYTGALKLEELVKIC